VHAYTYIFAYLSSFKKGGGVCNLIYRSLFYYYSDYSTTYFLLYTSLSSVYFPSLWVLSSTLYIREKRIEGGEVDRERGNKQTYLLRFLKKEEERGQDRQKKKKGLNILAPPFTGGLKQILVIRRLCER